MLPLYCKIEELCQTAGINITQLCQATGVPRSALSDYKTGRKKSISLKNLERIADYFGISLDTLTGRVLPTGPMDAPLPQAESLDINTLEYALYGEARDLDDDEKQQLLDLALLLKRKKEELKQKLDG